MRDTSLRNSSGPFTKTYKLNKATYGTAYDVLSDIYSSRNIITPTSKTRTNTTKKSFFSKKGMLGTETKNPTPMGQLMNRSRSIIIIDEDNDKSSPHLTLPTIDVALMDVEAAAKSKAKRLSLL